MSTPVQRFTPLTRSRGGVLEALRALVDALIAHRWHISLAFQRDFASVARFTRLGAVWNYILPLVPLGAYTLLMALRFFPSFGDVNGATYVTLGATLWLFYSGLIITPISVVESQFANAARANAPLIATIIASLGTLAFETLVRFAMVAAVFAILEGAPSVWILSSVALLLPSSLLFFSAGLFLAILNLALRDTLKIVRILITYGIFFSGVLFPVGSNSTLEAISRFNPFYVFIETIRENAVAGPRGDWISIAAFSAIGVVLFLIAVRLLYVIELRLRGRA